MTGVNKKPNSMRASLSAPHAWAVARLGASASVGRATGRLSQTRRNRPLVGAGLVLLNAAGVIVLLWMWWQFNLYRADGSDMRSYYDLNLAHLYGSSVLGERGSYLYSPVFAILVAPFTLLPWSLFYALWTGLAIGALALALGPAVAAVAILLLSPVQIDIGYGNIHALLTLAIVAGMRWPGAWSFVLLTKVTPGIGILWFAVRREWRSLGWALGVTLALVVASLLIVGVGAWVDWFHLLATSTRPTVWNEHNVIPLPLSIRLVLAAGLVSIGALRSWRWLVPVACFVAMPITWTHSLVLLLAVIPLMRWPSQMIWERETPEAGAAPTT